MTHNKSDDVSVLIVLQHSNMIQDLPSIYKPKPNILDEVAVVEQENTSKQRDS